MGMKMFFRKFGAVTVFIGRRLEISLENSFWQTFFDPYKKCTFLKGSTSIKSEFFFFSKITSKITIFELCHNYVPGHQKEQLLYFTVFCGTNGIQVMAILMCHTGPGPQPSKSQDCQAHNLENSFEKT